MTEREALADLLEAVELAIYSGDWKVDGACDPDVAIQRAKDVLAQPWEKFCDSNCVWTDHHPDCKLAQRTWVGLTDEDIKPFCDANHIIFGAYTIDFVRAIEAKLKEKNTHD
jgi:hypothetical protein